jgi:CheY-like chemotaxis protein
MGLRTPPVNTSAGAGGDVDYRSCRVLVVDDSLINVKILTRMLHDLGLSVYTASDGLQAVEAVQKLAAVSASNKANRKERQLKRELHLQHKEAGSTADSTLSLPHATRSTGMAMLQSGDDSSNSSLDSSPAPCESPTSSAASSPDPFASDKPWRAKRHFDIILSDVNMPVMSGLESSQRIRALEKEHGLPKVPIIAVTANSSVEDRADAGMNYFVQKPFVKRDVLKLVEQILSAQALENTRAKQAEKQQRHEVTHPLSAPASLTDAIAAHTDSTSSLSIVDTGVVGFSAAIHAVPLSFLRTQSGEVPMQMIGSPVNVQTVYRSHRTDPEAHPPTTITAVTPILSPHLQ